MHYSLIIESVAEKGENYNEYSGLALLNHLIRNINNEHGHYSKVIPPELASRLNNVAEEKLAAIWMNYNSEKVEKWFKVDGREWNNEYYELFHNLVLKLEECNSTMDVDDVKTLLEVVTSQSDFKDLIFTVNFNNGRYFDNRIEGQIYALNGQVDNDLSNLKNTIDSLENTSKRRWLKI